MLNKTIFILLILFSSLNAKLFQTVPIDKITIIQKGKDKIYCPNCGMNLAKFWKTSHAVELKNGTIKQFCSIYCLVEQLEITTLRGKEDMIKKYLVVDVISNKYIDAKKAFYVIGSSKKGTMSATSKYAFKNKSDAKAFMNKNGGIITNFDGAYQIAIKDFAKDANLVAIKRGTKMYKIGEKLYNSICDKEKIALLHAHTMGEMKALIEHSNVCNLKSKGFKKDMQLQAIMLYYWDKRLKDFKKLYGKNEKIEK